MSRRARRDRRELPGFYRDLLKARNLVTFSQDPAPQGEGGVVDVTVGVKERRVHGAIPAELTPAQSEIVHRAHGPGPSPRAGPMQHEPPFRDAQRAVL